MGAEKDNSSLSSSASGSAVGEKILIADNDSTNLTLLRDMVLKYGYSCETATDSPEVIEKAKKINPDIIILDALMPVTGGIDTCRELKSAPETMHIPVIVVSPSDEKNIIKRCMDLGANDFIIKPVDSIGLITRIRNLLQLRGIENKNKSLEAIFKIIEKAKREWEQTVDFIDDIVMLVDENDQIIRCNRPLSTLTGKPFNDLLNRKWQEVLKENGLRETVDNLGDVGFYHASGKWFNYQVYHTKKAETVHKAAAIITIQEVTERKRKEKEMRLLQRLTHAVNDSLDFNSALSVLLKELCETTGWVYSDAWMPSTDKAHLVCSPVYFQKAEGLEQFRKAREQSSFYPGAGLAGRAWSSKKVILAKDLTEDVNLPELSYAAGAGIRSSVAMPVMLNDEVALVINLFTFEPKNEDEGLITVASNVVSQLGSALHKKRSEDELKKHKETLEEKNRELEEAYTKLKLAQSQILQQEKMASVGQLAAGVAHEINNPIGFIMSNLRSLQKYTDKLAGFIAAQREAIDAMTKQAGDQGSEIAERIKENRKTLKVDFILEDLDSLVKESLDGTDRVKKIVEELRHFSRADEAEHKTADINAGIESTIRIAWNELKYKATLKKELGEIPLTKCNLGQLNQVFLNLLVNAAHAIEKQGEIAVKTWSDSSNIYISISDTGHGIPEEKIDRIFEPFFTTKEAGKGTGLGLSIAYDIVKRHGGEIGVRSATGKGTTFTIRIPVVDG